MNNEQIIATEDIMIHRTESSFDRACDEAYRSSIHRFGIDSDGHSERLKEWERSCCRIDIDFINYKRIGEMHLYNFKVSVIKTIFEEDDE